MATISATPSATSGTITSTGLGSGLDINGLVSQLIAADSQPINQLNAKETQYQAQLTAYGNVKSALSSFQSAVSGLTSASAFQAVAANSGDTSVYTASADGTAVPGSYDIEVVNLAKSQKLASGPFATVNDAVGTGILTFQFGTDNAGVFTENGDRPAKTVTIDSDHGSLSGIRDAINAANIGVSATIINDGTGYRLSLTSSQTGAANSLKITVSGDADGDSVDNADLSQLAYDPAGTADNGKNMTETVAAQDATLNVDGINDIKKPSNTITDLIQGVTLNLLQPSQSDVPASLTVGRDTTSALGLVQKFVDAYNDLHKTLSDATAYDPDTQQGGILLGDSTVLALDRQLRAMLTTSVPGASGDYKVLSNIGVSFQKDGTLSVSATQLQAALADDPQGVASLFATVGKTGDGLISYSSATSATKPGSYAVNVTQLATQAYLKGTTTPSLANTDGTLTTPLVIDSSNDTLALQVDGVQTDNISLTHGTYTTGAALAAELQSRINGDSALTDASSAVTVSFDDATGALTITSNRYGSASNISVLSAAAGMAGTLGLGASSGTAGVDVAGTINGIIAAGSGQFLTGAFGDASSGLKIQITGGALGARGTVDYSQGYADQLDAFVGAAIGTTGPIAARTDGINKSIADVKDQVTTLNARLATLQQQYLAQFNAMDVLVAQMKSTGDFLTQQLATIAANSSTGK